MQTIQKVFLSIKIINDVDPESAKPKPGTGLGLANIRERLKILYGSDQYLKTFREEIKFTAELYLPDRQA